LDFDTLQEKRNNAKEEISIADKKGQISMPPNAGGADKISVRFKGIKIINRLRLIAMR